MDIVTQALLGASVAVSGAKQSEIKQAALIGAAAGILADADVFIRSTSDPLLSLEFHRHFSHALIFIPFGALIAACFIWLVYRLLPKSPLNFGRIYYYSLLGYMLSGVLDASTSYGTHLYWPFVDERISWRLVSIVDPIFSGLLILGLVISVKTKALNATRIALSLCAFYLAFSYSQSRNVHDELFKLAALRGHEIERFVVKPTFGNVVLWRTVYLNKGRYYIDAIRTLFDTKIYEGSSITAINVNNDFPDMDKSSLQFQDIVRFNYFSDGYIVKPPGQPNIIGDVRYSMFPISAQPLWGIEINPESPDTHARYATFRDNDAVQRRLFIDMVFAND